MRSAPCLKTWLRRRGYGGKCSARSPRNLSSCDTPGRTRAAETEILVMHSGVSRYKADKSKSIQDGKTHSRCQHWSSEPHGVSLHVMSDDLNVDGLRLPTESDFSCVKNEFRLHVLRLPLVYLQLAAAQLLAHFQSRVNSPLEVPLKASAEVPEHGGASGEHDVLKQKPQQQRWRTFRQHLSCSEYRSGNSGWKVIKVNHFKIKGKVDWKTWTVLSNQHFFLL